MPEPATVTTTESRSGPAQDWRILVAVFWVTSMVEGLGVSQIFALLPTYLREMGVPDSQRLTFIGGFSALIFIVGMPLVPLWGAWADKYSRKVVIVRSALVEAVVFIAVALAREPWQVALAMLLIGLFTTFQWPSLFPSVRDYLALASLPVRMRKVFTAKFIALVVFAAFFVLAVTSLPSIILPAVMAGRYTSGGSRQALAI